MALRVSNHNLASALVCFGFAAAVFIGAVGLGLGTLERPGPGLTPLLYACLLAVLSLLQAFRSIRAAEIFDISIHWRNLLQILGVLLCFALLLERLGYIVCTFAVMGLLARIASVSWVTSLVFAGVSTLVVHFLFVRWLCVLLPTGSIFP